MNNSKGQKKGFSEKQVKLIKRLLIQEPSKRNLCLFSVQIDSMLRSSDVLSLQVRDIQDHKGKVREEISIKQQKTGTTLSILLQEDTRKALTQFLEESGKEDQDFLFTAAKGNRKEHITLMGHSKLVKKWVSMIGLDPKEYATHSLRRTKSAIIYERTGNVEVVRQLLGQTSCVATSRYLGIDKKKSLEICKGVVL